MIQFLGGKIMGQRVLPSVITSIRSQPRSVFAIDIDGDGDIDILTASLYR